MTDVADREKLYTGHITEAELAALSEEEMNLIANGPTCQNGTLNEDGTRRRMTGGEIYTKLVESWEKTTGKSWDKEQRGEYN